MSTKQLPYPSDEPGTRTEWRVTGDAGPAYGPYRYVFTDEEELLTFLDPGHAFARNVKDIRVHHRQVTVGEWIADDDLIP